METQTLEQTEWLKRDAVLNKKWGLPPDATFADRFRSLFAHLDTDEQLRHIIEGVRNGAIPTTEEGE